jgi:hypothetical protein
VQKQVFAWHHLILEAAAYIARKITDEACGHRADIFDGNEPALWHSGASLVDKLIEVINP